MLQSSVFNNQYSISINTIAIFKCMNIFLEVEEGGREPIAKEKKVLDFQSNFLRWKSRRET